MTAGRLQLAEMKLNEAVRLVSSMSKVGGEACLQWAICVDSQVWGCFSRAKPNVSAALIAEVKTCKHMVSCQPLPQARAHTHAWCLMLIGQPIHALPCHVPPPGPQCSPCCGSWPALARGGARQARRVSVQ